MIDHQALGLMLSCQVPNFHPEYEADPQAVPLIENLLTAVCAHTGVTRRQIMLKGKKPKPAYARQICVYLMFRHYHLELNQVAAIFDIETRQVYRSANLITAFIGIYDDTRRDVEQIINLLEPQGRANLASNDAAQTEERA